ncbi:hypothetical protein GCM10027423_39860 [Spirosoma arcticum]
MIERVMFQGLIIEQADSILIPIGVIWFRRISRHTKPDYPTNPKVGGLHLQKTNVGTNEGSKGRQVVYDE